MPRKPKKRPRKPSRDSFGRFARKGAPKSAPPRRDKFGRFKSAKPRRGPGGRFQPPLLPPIRDRQGQFRAPVKGSELVPSARVFMPQQDLFPVDFAPESAEPDTFYAWFLWVVPPLGSKYEKAGIPIITQFMGQGVVEEIDFLIEDYIEDNPGADIVGVFRSSKPLG